MNAPRETTEIPVPQKKHLLRDFAALKDSKDPGEFLIFFEQLKGLPFNSPLWASFLRRVAGSVRYNPDGLHFDLASESCKRLLREITEFVAVQPQLADKIRKASALQWALSDISAALAQQDRGLAPVKPVFTSLVTEVPSVRCAMPDLRQHSCQPYQVGWPKESSGFRDPGGYCKHTTFAPGGTLARTRRR